MKQKVAQTGLLIVSLLLITVGTWARHKRRQEKHQPPNEIIAASVRYGGCYGHCTEYSIELNSDGIVTYTGIRFAKDSGAYTRNIDKSEASRILRLFQSYRVDTCPLRYPNRIPDLPSMTFNIKYTDSTKRILFANFGPHYFKELSSELEKVGRKENADGWEKVITPAIK